LDKKRFFSSNIGNMQPETSTLKPHKKAGTSQTGIQRKNSIRIVSCASLFDGHDVSINIMRRILQRSGAEVIHLGHNRSVREVVECAIQEDAQGIAISSYQGGHVEYFKYVIDVLKEFGSSHIKVFGGGGGVIAPDEIKELHEYGVTRIFSVEDGLNMGLQGMIDFILDECDYDVCELKQVDLNCLNTKSHGCIARAITTLELNRADLLIVSQDALIDPRTGTRLSIQKDKVIPVIGITGTGGAGKSSLTDELVRRFLAEFPDKHIAVISVDPSKITNGGALLGDRIRMNSVSDPRVYMRSLATRASNRATSDAVYSSVMVCKSAGYDIILVETSGIGQSDIEITELSDIYVYVMTSDYGAPTQLEKINMLDLAHLVVINKFEKKGSLDALRDIRKQYKRNHAIFDINDNHIPVFPCIAAQFNDEGVNRLFSALVIEINKKYEINWKSTLYLDATPTDEINSMPVIPSKRIRYLAEVSETVEQYHHWVNEQIDVAGKLESVVNTCNQLEKWNPDQKEVLISSLVDMEAHWRSRLDKISLHILDNWDQHAALLQNDYYELKIRDKVSKIPLYRTSLSGIKIPRVAIPKYKSYADRLKFALLENLPGYFPFTAGVFPFKRDHEDPIRMFAGEGTPERTNKRFHYLSKGQPAIRLSTAFDSPTLYGEDPDSRPDIYGKIGNSGVSICNLDDMKKLFSGFRLTESNTSVSMTINGPAPMILAMFMNTVIDQEIEHYLIQTMGEETLKSKVHTYFEKIGTKQPTYSGLLPEGNNGFGLRLLGITGDKLVDSATYNSIKEKALQVVRGTVQADILKEDQAQNTCIFSTEFALRMMGDVQEYFTSHQVRNYYSVSISGYHIAEAGANPISQVAFTLANGFTYVEYYLSRGLKIDDFAHNLSFFFSNGLDPEYSVIGRVARRIWAVAMKHKYGANERSQKLKYHIQTSGRSLHAQEIQFNDIRTTLQALMAIYDNCNSLHTNAYDEAVTTPTEESVRRALAIQLIINRELGLAKNENILQGSFLIEELTDLVEKAILTEFEHINDRGGVIGAMETMYQRGKIQEESLYYETLKHNGELPIIGVNTFVSHETHEKEMLELIRSTKDEKQQQIEGLHSFMTRNQNETPLVLNKLQAVARNRENLFSELMETVKTCSLGQISNALYQVGGQYRRNM
jgi:methylmalonyl-CoA mutase